jgi:hypothetical protein
MLTGNAPYRTILYRMLDPRLHGRLAIAMLDLVARRIAGKG